MKLLQQFNFAAFLSLIHCSIGVRDCLEPMDVRGEDLRWSGGSLETPEVEAMNVKLPPLIKGDKQEDDYGFFFGFGLRNPGKS